MTFVIPLLLLATSAGSPVSPSVRVHHEVSRHLCEIVAGPELELLLGRLLTSREAGSACQYVARDGSEAQVIVSRQQLPSKLNLREEAKNLSEAMPGSSLHPVNGLGSAAWLLNLGPAGVQLHILRGDSEYLLVSVLGFGDAALVTNPAQSIASRLLTRTSPTSSAQTF